MIIDKSPIPDIEGYKETIPSKERFPTPEQFINDLENLGLQEYAEVYKKVIEIAQAIKENGGQTLLVGGSVRDALMKKIPKD